MINKTGRIGKLFKSYGLAQIPLLIGLLIMAIAVPVATKLVEENQDTRNLAAVCSPVGEFCLTTSNCCSGQCVNNICGGGYASPTPKPLATSTPRPENTSTPRPENTSTPRPTAVTPQSSPTPTGATGTCTTISGQWCTAGLCRDKGGTVGVGVCGGGQYCCQPNTSTCVQTGGSCLTGTCCAGNQCIDQGGYPTCYKDSQIPTLFPKLTPAATVTPGTFEQCCPRYDTAYSKNTCTGASENACNINIKYCVPSTSSTCPPYEPGTGPTGGPIVTQPPIEITKTPTGVTCNENLTGNLLQCCHPPDSDGTSDDSLCNRAGKVATCGGKDYCCPTFNGNWTTDMSKCNLKCTMCANGKNRSIGDADCNGVVDVNDRSIWASEFVSDGGNGTVKNTWMADFDCNGVVDVNDRSIWAANFKI